MAGSSEPRAIRASVEVVPDGTVCFHRHQAAAWKLLGKAQLAAGDRAAARAAWEQGIAAAQAHGDKQAEKEMTVFLKKLDKQL